MTGIDRKISCRHDPARRLGFTIVEMLVALAASSFLILGAATFFVTAHKSGNVQSALSGLNVSGRFGLDQIARDIRMSGSRESNWTTAQAIEVIATVDGLPANGGDSITLRYEGVTDCSFAPAVAGIVANTYRVQNSRLECNGQAITGGVQEMQVYLGEDIDNDGVANRWMIPGTAGLTTSRIVSVRLHLLTITSGIAISSGSQAYFFNNAQQAAIDDGQIRREYTMTVALRNRT